MRTSVRRTGMPRRDISATGMLFVPVPARAIPRTLGGIVMSCMSRERTRMPCGFSTALPTLYLVEGKRCRPAAAIGLSVKMR